MGQILILIIIIVIFIVFVYHKNKDIESKCGWSPFNGMEFKGTPVFTIIAGKIKMQNGKIMGKPEGLPLKFK